MDHPIRVGNIAILDAGGTLTSFLLLVMFSGGWKLFTLHTGIKKLCLV